MKFGEFYIQTAIMAGIALVLVAIGYLKGDGQHIKGLQSGLGMIVPTLPLILAAFIVAGLMQALIPKDVVVRWLGADAGLRGIAVGAMAGAFTPGGPFTSFPIAAGLVKAGASIGPVVAFLSGWLLLGVTKLPLEVGFVGWQVTLARVGSTFFVPFLAGWIAQTLFSRLGTGVAQ
ncbi:MAG: permease [Nitrospinota bacterium]|nr:permease [Nitrospinota bacterium]